MVAVHVFVSPGAQVSGQHHRSEAHANEPAHGTAHRLEEAPHLVVSTLAEDDMEPSVRALASRGPQRVETCFPIVQRNPAGKRLERLSARCTVYPDRVLPFDSGTRMHEPVGQLTVVGEQEQPGGIEVQSTDRDPPGPAEHGKLVEYRRSSKGVAARRHLAGRLVVADEPSPEAGAAHRLAVDAQNVAGSRPIPERRGVSVDGDPSAGDPAFDLAS